jgi:hypothetical protein
MKAPFSGTGSPFCNRLRHIQLLWIATAPTRHIPPFRNASTHSLKLSGPAADAVVVILKIRFVSIAILFASLVHCRTAQAQSAPPVSTMPSPSGLDVESLPTRVAPATDNANLPSAPPIHITTRIDSPVKGVIRRPFRTWLALSIGGQAAVLADVKTTLDLRRSYPLTFHESDPLARPFVNLPAPAYVASSVALTAGLSAAAWKLSTSENHWLGRHWWLPQAAQIILNAECAVHNARLN